MENPTQKGAYSVNEFLEWASISRASFYREIEAGNLKIHKFGTKTLVTAENAMAWLNSLPEAA